MNCFAPLPEKLSKQRVLFKDRVFDEIREEWNLIPKASTFLDNDGVKQDIIIYEPVLKTTYKIADYVNSFANDVGIQNILEKIRLSGDKSYLNQTGRVGEKPDGGLEDIKDYTDVPGSKTEAFNAVVEGVNAYDKLPADVKEKMSFAQFAESFGQEQLNAYVEKMKAAYAAQNAPKEEDK